ncbi:hypothetical protein Taro_051565 [Colocasia esculenta]|uniref:Uncharacterized protein n=1 Tax=Colocasia esculenta TaxID=4460 RepID=A0A843XH93_COLES|nr:hypothetical protein [Colocasia esculenta]
MCVVNVSFEQVKSRVGPEMKQDLLLFSWSWRLGVAVDWLASSALVVGGTDTSRRTGPQLVLFQCLTLASPGQGLWRCQAWACDRVLCSRQTVRARRTFLVRCPVQGRVVAVQGQYLQRSSSSSIALQLFTFFSCTSGYAPEISEMADRRDWGGGGDDPGESTQRMIGRI